MNEENLNFAIVLVSLVLFIAVIYFVLLPIYRMEPKVDNIVDEINRIEPKVNNVLNEIDAILTAINTDLPIVKGAMCKFPLIPKGTFPWCPN
jgi:predicted PurR-regulated permease PerM